MQKEKLAHKSKCHYQFSSVENHARKYIFRVRSLKDPKIQRLKDFFSLVPKTFQRPLRAQTDNWCYKYRSYYYFTSIAFIH